MFGSLVAPFAAQVGGAALKYGGQAIGNFAAGKMGETISGYNENVSDEHREAARKLNVDPATYAKVHADLQSKTADQTQGRNNADIAFNNQLAMGNSRANATTRMALKDQDIAASQAEQLANSYNTAVSNQNNASANMANAAASLTRNQW